LTGEKYSSTSRNTIGAGSFVGGRASKNGLSWLLWKCHPKVRGSNGLPKKDYWKERLMDPQRRTKGASWKNMFRRRWEKKGRARGGERARKKNNSEQKPNNNGRRRKTNFVAETIRKEKGNPLGD